MEESEERKEERKSGKVGARAVSAWMEESGGFIRKERSGVRCGSGLRRVCRLWKSAIRIVGRRKVLLTCQIKRFDAFLSLALA